MDHRLQEIFESEGFLKFDNYLSGAELKKIEDELTRFTSLEAEEKYITDNGFTAYGVHDRKFKTGAKIFHDLSISSRFLGVAQKLLDTENLYVYNSKVNCKNKFFGSNMHWHQDYFYWKLDGVPEDTLVTFLILPKRTTEVDGCLYVIPGSHKGGFVNHSRVLVGEHKQFAVNPMSLSKSFEDCSEPVPLIGDAGCVYIFNSTIIHGSSNNLGPSDRSQIYFSYNITSNVPSRRSQSRPEFVVSQNNQSLKVLDA
jgi:ectoine hydroxylase